MKTHKKRAAMPALAMGNFLLERTYDERQDKPKTEPMMSMQRPVNRHVSIFWPYGKVPADLLSPEIGQSWVPTRS